MANKHDWFQHWFGPDYLLVYSHRSEAQAREEVSFLLRIIDQLSGTQDPKTILDMACGNGRHLIALAERNNRVVGADLSQTLLEHARDQYSPLKGSMLRCDMREFCYAPQCFDVVVNLFTSIGYFESDEETQRVFQNIGEILKPGGIFILDYLNPEIVAQSLKPQTERKVGTTTIIEVRRFDTKTKRLIKEITISNQSNTRSYLESVRVYSSSEIRDLFAAANIDVVMQFGDYRGNPFHPSSPRMITVGRA